MTKERWLGVRNDGSEHSILSMNSYDVIVIGAGHAGIEASLACARMGCKTLLVTFNKETIGLMSCNPAIGGVGKGQLVKELDALGGQMGRAADACAIQFRILNASKGPAVQSSRAQIDMNMYNRYMRECVGNQENLAVGEAEAEGLIVKANAVRGIVTKNNEEIFSSVVIVSAGTFLDGVIHIGLNQYSAGRINEPAAIGLENNLRELGFRLLRFKTGTCARLDKNTIDYSGLKIQEGDFKPKPFSFSDSNETYNQIPCYLTYTNKKTHEIIRRNLNRSPLYCGKIKSTGVRYCPSIEDKVVKFSDRERHQIFLEPQGRDAPEIYPNGISTSLPEDAQVEFIHSIAGLEDAKVLRFGYGIEHSIVEPTQIYPTLETKLIKNLYLAGQINGTTGYEEAAAQGLVAGINAGLRIKNKEPVVLDRSTSYIGVLLDDLTTKGTLEPYRMFTSRVEYRLLLREDNADLRLARIGFEAGLVSQPDYERIQVKIEAIKKGLSLLKTTRINPTEEINKRLFNLGTSPIKKATTLAELLKRPQVDIENLSVIARSEAISRESLRGGCRRQPAKQSKEIASLANGEQRLTRNDKGEAPSGLAMTFGEQRSDSVLRQLEIELKYSGFIQRQIREVERFCDLERIKLPQGLNYADIPGLSKESKEKLNKLQPLNLGRASRISGVTPAAISILMVYLKNNSDAGLE